MRNVFDQYSQPENRLTHALVASLDADRSLLRGFLESLPLRSVPRGRLTVLEQSLPGEPEASGDDGETEGRRLPDGWIHDENGWALLIESKLAASPDLAQVRGHLRMAERHGATDVTLLWLTVTPVRHALPKGVVNRTWTEVYTWLTHSPRQSAWAERAAQYFEVAEVQADMKKQLKTGTLTEFTGIPFGVDTPYNYSQAKRLLGLLRERLTTRSDLKRKLGIDPAHMGRGAIRGTKGTHVWDFIAFRELAGGANFTKFPHLTLGISNMKLDAMVTFPHKMSGPSWRGLLRDNFDLFAVLVHEATNGIGRSLRRVDGALPRVVVVQRRYSSISADPVNDVLLEFDPRTAFKTRGKRQRGSVPFQPQWLEMLYEVLCHRRSNLQFQIGAFFPYKTCSAVKREDIAALVAGTWIACKPLVDAVRG
jgi:hypothetical protein